MHTIPFNTEFYGFYTWPTPPPKKKIKPILILYCRWQYFLIWLTLPTTQVTNCSSNDRVQLKTFSQYERPSFTVFDVTYACDTRRWHLTAARISRGEWAHLCTLWQVKFKWRTRQHMLPTSTLIYPVTFYAWNWIAPGGTSKNCVHECACWTLKFWLSLYLILSPFTTHQYTNFVQKHPIWLKLGAVYHHSPKYTQFM